MGEVPWDGGGFYPVKWIEDRVGGGGVGQFNSQGF